MKQHGLLLAMLGLLALSGCAGVPSVGERQQRADALAMAAHLQHETVAAGSFLLTSYARITRTDQPLTVYIEGDGFAWRTRTQPSDDPTPIAAQGLSLAAVDPGANVVYLARPCQFSAPASNPACRVAYWTAKRFAPEVVASMDQAVSHYAARVPGQAVHLVGYSGGGAIATLIAARRQDVASLRTVAGNLDQAEVNRLHRVSAMPDSLNAIDVAPQLAALPQLHISGAADNVVPPAIAERFVHAVASPCAQRLSLPGMGHSSDWAQAWPKLLGISLSCSR